MDNWIWKAPDLDKLIYFTKSVVKQQKVWIMEEEDGFMQIEPDSPYTVNKFSLVVYPNREMGEIVCQKKGFENYYIGEIELKEFLYKWCFQLMKDGGTVTLFFDGKNGYMVEDLRGLINGIEAMSHELTSENALPFTEFEEKEEGEECPPLNEYVFNNMMKASQKKRYKYFIGHVTQWQQIWVLMHHEEDIACLQDNNDFVGMGVWPHKDYAAYIQKEPEFSDCMVSSIEVHDFVDTYIPYLKKEGTKIALFYNGEDFVCIDNLDRLKEDIEEELDRIE